MHAKVKTVGVLMLETQFPRLIGDIGNPDGFDFPIIYKTIDGASPKRVVDEQDHQLVPGFIEGALELVDRGAEIITTSCGFLARFQVEIQAALPVPAFTSALLLLDELEHVHGKGNVGVLTISHSAMTQSFLEDAGIDVDTPIGSTEEGDAFTAAILSNQTSFDEDACARDMKMAAKALIAKHPHIRAILLECTNMPPYSRAVEEATGLPVYSLNTLLQSLVAPT